MTSSTSPAAEPESKARVTHLPAESRGQEGGRDRLVGRRVLVVGAGQNSFGLDDAPIGNGRAMTLLFAREGATVAAADRDEPSLDEPIAQVGAAGGQAVPVVADVSDPGSVTAMVAGASEQLGGLDGVVYNVGIGAGFGLAGTSPEQWDRVFAVNLRGAMLTVQAAMPGPRCGVVDRVRLLDRKRPPG